jgi:hypothetical protein
VTREQVIAQIRDRRGPQCADLLLTGYTADEVKRILKVSKNSNLYGRLTELAAALASPNPIRPA